MRSGGWVERTSPARHRSAINSLEIGSVIPGNGTIRVVLLQNFRSDARGDVCEVRESIHTAVEISPDGFDLSDIK